MFLSLRKLPFGQKILVLFFCRRRTEKQKQKRRNPELCGILSFSSEINFHSWIFCFAFRRTCALVTHSNAGLFVNKDKTIHSFVRLFPRSFLVVVLADVVSKYGISSEPSSEMNECCQN